jgi:hypothetical protein
LATDQPSGFQNPEGNTTVKKVVGRALTVLLQTKRLQIARELPDAELLVRELEGFRMKPPPKSDDPMADWRDGPHDDLIFAVALAGWVGEKCLMN